MHVDGEGGDGESLDSDEHYYDFLYFVDTGCPCNLCTGDTLDPWSIIAFFESLIRFTTMVFYTTLQFSTNQQCPRNHYLKKNFHCKCTIV